MQTYNVPNGGTTPSSAVLFTPTGEKFTPTLPTLIEQLQNIHLLSQDVPAGNYALTRSIEELTLNVAGAIAQVDARILEAITMNPAASCQ